MDKSLALNTLKKYFGYDSFRPLQDEVIQTICSQKNVLVLMPTGGGKSICFQVPAIFLPGTCVVVSPLIALMKDQVENLRLNGVKAAFLNSSQLPAEQLKVEQQFADGQFDLLYISPEKLLSQDFNTILKATTINLFAIDEAHCISSWGHDFRPEYTQLKFLKREFPNIPVAAFTATADKVTRKDILHQLGIDDAKTFIASFDRPNLSIEVREGKQRLQQIVRFIRQHEDQPGIIYCLSRKSTEELSKKLIDHGIRAAPYHAGLTSHARAKCQDDFVRDNILVICATIAFGMGIDKSNIRWVIHYNLPKNIEGYYQEIGRAGRDGAPAETILFYSYNDVMVLQNILEKNESAQTEIQITKLYQMKDFAEALICRKVMLMNYFNENRSAGCGNCDVCHNPPQYFDGTVIAQKALSAIIRMNKQVGATMLVNVLRGANRSDIREKGFDKIKTYGAGRDLTIEEWQFYIRQLNQQGILEIAPDQNNILIPSGPYENILYENQEVLLVKYKDFRNAQKKAPEVKISPKVLLLDELTELLKKLRKTLAQESGKPPYMIFSDSTLQHMVKQTPLTISDFLAIPGFTPKNYEDFGHRLSNCILDFILQNNTHFKGVTQKLSFILYKNGKSVEEIAQERNLASSTIESHLAQIYESGEELEIGEFLSDEEQDILTGYIKALEPPFIMRQIFEHFNGLYSFSKIRFAIAVHNRMQFN